MANHSTTILYVLLLKVNASAVRLRTEVLDNIYELTGTEQDVGGRVIGTARIIKDKIQYNIIVTIPLS
jgi:hypothetical protein